MKETIAVFDFDKTITDRHTFIRFFKFNSGNLHFYSAFIVLLPYIVSYKLGKIDVLTLREKAINYFFRGLTQKKYLENCLWFVNKKINRWLSEEAINRIEWHKTQNHKLVLLSNSPEDYLKIWAKQFGFDIVIGSRFEFEKGISTGKLYGDHCFGKEKVVRLQSALGNLNQYYIYGYGDSEGDKELLEISDQPFYRFFNLTKRYAYPNKE